jgi:imidazoleglycerol phosphate synthase cyclase subunit
MITTRVIPCLDVRDGRIVKGIRFSNLRDAGDPAERAALYEKDGADEIVMLDISATPQGRRAAVETVKRLRDVLRIPLTVGGGVRSADDAAALLSAGADKIGVNTAAVTDPSLLTTLADRFGRQCVVIAVDAERRGPGWGVVVRSGTDRTDLDAVAWARQSAQLGAGEILLTSVDRDGTRAGYDLDLIRAVCGSVRVPVIASGGTSDAQHLIDAVRAGASAVLAASIFHESSHSVRDVKLAMRRGGLEVRL